MCDICFEKRRPEEFIRTSCGCRACSDCHLHWARSQIDHSPAILRCPMPQCMTPLTTTDLLSILDQDTQEQLEEAQTWTLVRTDPEYRRCPTCNAPGFAAKRQRNFQCIGCGKCWKEAGLKVANPVQVLTWMWLEGQSWLWKRTFCKQCPSCFAYIEKNEGCKHMECFKCGYEFCWLCFQEWKQHSESLCSGFMEDFLPIHFCLLALLFTIKSIWTVPLLGWVLVWVVVKTGIIAGMVLNAVALAKVMELGADAIVAVSAWRKTGVLRPKKYPLRSAGALLYVVAAILMELPVQLLVLSVANTALWTYLLALGLYVVLLVIQTVQLLR